MRARPGRAWTKRSSWHGEGNATGYSKAPEQCARGAMEPLRYRDVFDLVSHQPTTTLFISSSHTIMDTWKSFTNTLSGAAANAAASAPSVGSRLTQSWGQLSQQARERWGALDASDITELPAEYTALEARVDGLSKAHGSIARIFKVYENEGYDCPVNLQGSVGDASRTVAQTIGTWAAQARGAAAPTPTDEHPPRTLSHTISRSMAQASVELESSPQEPQEQRDDNGPALAAALQRVSVASNAVGTARLEQDHEIIDAFLVPWVAFGNQVALAQKARAQVREARLNLDASKQVLKSVEASSGPADSTRVETTRVNVEHAEDKLVSATEDAIGLMKIALSNPEPVRLLSTLLKMYVLSFPLLLFLLSPKWDMFPDDAQHVWRTDLVGFVCVQSSRVPSQRGPSARNCPYPSFD